MHEHVMHEYMVTFHSISNRCKHPIVLFVRLKLLGKIKTNTSLYSSEQLFVIINVTYMTGASCHNHFSVYIFSFFFKLTNFLGNEQHLFMCFF